jgi:voltage-gated sodium channel
MELFPYAWVFFVFFILIATFIVFNLFISVIVDSITADKDKDDRNHSHQSSVQEELQHLRNEMAALRQLIEKQNR